MSSASLPRRYRRIELSTLVVSLVALVAAAAMLIGLIRKYPWVFAEALSGVEVVAWPWGVLAAVAAGPLCFRHARAVGYSLGTLVLVGLAVTCCFFWQRWPDKSVSLFGGGVMTGTVLLIAVILCLAWFGAQIWERWNFMDRVETAQGAQADVESKLLSVEANVARQEATITALQKKREELAVQITGMENARKAEAREAADREDRFVQRRLYEAQYVGGFLVAVGFRVAQVRQTRPLSINYLQGGRDAQLADLVSATAGRFWLIEFKRSTAELKDEFTKHTREQQIIKLVKHPDVVALADRCHFIGWGVQRGDVPELSLSRYLDLWREPKQFSSSPLMQAEAFLAAAIPDHEEVATIGVPASEFQRYLQLLELWGGSATGDDDFAALVMYRDARGSLRFLTEPSFGSFMQGVRIANENQINKEEARRLRMERDNEGPSHRSGPSPSL